MNKWHFEFQEIQEYGNNFITYIPTKLVPDKPEKVFESIEDEVERVLREINDCRI